MQVLAEGDTRSRLIWIVDVLPNEIAPYIDAQMDQGALAVRKTLSRSAHDHFPVSRGARRRRPGGRPWRQNGSVRTLRRLLGSRRHAISPKTAATRRRKGEWHFGWALEGRAIQDVWIVPPRGELRRGDAAANVNSCGTTLRVYDPRIDAWQMQWSDPVTQNFLQMIGRAQGDDIVQLGTRPDGKLMRWSFSEITPDSFHWRGEISADEGATWRLQVDFSGEACRIARSTWAAIARPVGSQ